MWTSGKPIQSANGPMASIKIETCDFQEYFCHLHNSLFISLLSFIELSVSSINGYKPKAQLTPKAVGTLGKIEISN